MRELAILQRPDRYEMVATSRLYLQSKFELANMNTCCSVVVLVNVYFVTASQKLRIIILRKVMQ
jgi:hypothetical protein